MSDFEVGSDPCKLGNIISELLIKLLCRVILTVSRQNLQKLIHIEKDVAIEGSQLLPGGFIYGDFGARRVSEVSPLLKIVEAVSEI